MRDHYDPWYVRLPDGRTIKAKSTASVRHHVEAGHIPLNSLVRRDSNEEWVGLVWVAEFSDLRKEAVAQFPPAAVAGMSSRSGVSARLDPLRLHTVGVRGLIDELIAAVDTTLAPAKMVPAFVAGVLLYLGLYAIPGLVRSLFEPPAWTGPAVGAAFAVLVLSLFNAVLAKLTHVELTTMRPARLGRALSAASTSLAPVLIATTIVAGGALALLWLLNRVPAWVIDQPGENGVVPTFFRALLLVVVLLLSVLIWLVVGLCWLLAPAIVVEESGLAGVREWRQLLREHFGRIVVYEGLAVLLGVAISLPLTLAVGLATSGAPALLPPWPVPPDPAETTASGTVLAAVHGLSAAPLLALLPVANVFIYLNLRYEQGR